MDNKDAAKKLADGTAKAEETVDKVVENVSKKVDDVIPDSAKKTAKDVAAKAEKAAVEVDKLAGKVDDFADTILPEQKGSDLEFQPQRREAISRVFIFRFLRIILQYPIIGIRAALTGVVAIIHFIYMLVTGKRHRKMRDFQNRYTRHMLKWTFYIGGLIDRRPEIVEK